MLSLECKLYSVLHPRLLGDIVKPADGFSGTLRVGVVLQADRLESQLYDIDGTVARSDAM